MSFFQKFEDLGFMDKGEKPSDAQEYSQSRGCDGGYPPQEGYVPSPNFYGRQRGYQQPPYGQQSYCPTPPNFAPPPLPVGWTQHWEPNAQRAYCVEQASGRSQWEQPNGPGQAPGYEASRGEGAEYYASGGYQGDQYAQQPVVEYQEEKKEKKDKEGFSTGAMIAAGVGGLAVGAIGGALIANELGDDDDDGDKSDNGDDAPRDLASDASGSDIDDMREAEDALREAQEDLEEAQEEVYDD